MALFELENDLDKNLKLRLSESFKEDFNFKKRFGCIPKSIMRFINSKDLMNLIENDKDVLNDVTLGKAKKRGSGYAKNMKYSTYSPNQAYFIIDYYTKKGYTILDPFMGRMTRPLITLLLERKYIGFDTCLATVEKNKEVINKNFKKSKYELHHSDGTQLTGIKNRSIDTVFSCPPYYDKEVYSGEEGDLSHMKYDEFDSQILSMFQRLSQVIKLSDYDNHIFYPVIFTVGTHRQGKKGIRDMEYIFNRCAFENGFILYDKLITENIGTGSAFTFRRNHNMGITTKTHETTLVYLLNK